ncbi:hypothetical protein J6590_040009 [Homalodisca vitripennis]|nr:hypothetical protein J6590_040009 [Homalodisca vitripennis]
MCRVSRLLKDHFPKCLEMFTKSGINTEHLMFAPLKYPLEWTAPHVDAWLRWCTRQFRLTPRPDPARLPNTGAELVALSRRQLQQLTDSPRSGRLLATHLAHLRHPRTGRSPSPCSEPEDDGGETPTSVLDAV